jgi:hypothetical protein
MKASRSGSSLNAVGQHANSRARSRRAAVAARRHEATFFERQTARLQKAIDRCTPDMDAATASLPVQLVQCQIWAHRNQLTNQSLMPLSRA